MNDEALQLLREIRDELRALRVERRGAAVLAHDDRAKLLALLPAIHAAIGALSFTVASLIEHASARDAAALREALSACRSTRSLGKLLTRCADQVVEGFHLRHIGIDGSGNLYMVEKGEETLRTLPARTGRR